MKTEIRDIAFTKNPPINKYNLWLHFNEEKKPVLELWSNGKWNVIGGDSIVENLPIVDLNNPSVTLNTINSLETGDVVQVLLTGNIDNVSLNAHACLSIDRESEVCFVTILLNSNAIRFHFNIHTGELIENTTNIYRLEQIEDDDIKDTIIQIMREHEVVESGVNVFEYNNYDLNNLMNYYNNTITNTQVCTVLNYCLRNYNSLIYKGKLVAKTFDTVVGEQQRIVLTEKRTLHSIVIKELSGTSIAWLNRYYEPLLNAYQRALR